MGIMGLLVFLVLVIGTGMAVYRSIAAPRDGRSIAVGDVGYAYGIGIGVLSIGMLCLSHMGILYSLKTITLSMLSVASVFVAVKRLTSRSGGKRALTGKSAQGALDLVERIFIVAIAVEIAFALFVAVIVPAESYDCVSIHVLKSKMFYIAKAIPGAYFKEYAVLYPHPDYPLNISLSQAAACIFMRRFDDASSKVIFALYYCASLAVIFASIRSFASRKVALAATFIMGSVPQYLSYASNGYTDLPLAFYILASVAALLKYASEKESIRPLILGAVMAGLAGWTKNEGMLFSCVAIVAVCALVMATGGKSRSTAIVRAAVFIAIVGAIVSPWRLTVSAHHIRNLDMKPDTFTVSEIPRFVGKAVTILYEFQKEYFNPKKWNILWPLATVVLIIYRKRAFNRQGVFMALVVGGMVLGYTASYMVSHLEISFFVSKTWSRFLIHFLPVVILWSAWALKEDYK